jgi:sugar phosphate isomerase/epimerase
MPEIFSAPRRVVGYALNVFPYETLDELWACLEGDVLRIKERAFPDEAFPIELRFSERIVNQLQQDCDRVARLKYFLDTHDLSLVTVNGFVMPHFHGGRVKERVYLPAWHESEARLRFTNSCVDLLAQLAPADAEFVSVSVPFGALKPVTMEEIAPNILKAGEQAARVNGIVALEPEPGLCVETTAEAVEFFQRFVPDRLRPHLAVNFDLSHQLVEFEDLLESLEWLRKEGIVVVKVHVSNATELPELVPFYEDSNYLHQVCGADAAGKRVYFSLDWPTQPPPPGIAKFRVHYHLPVFPTDMSTTLAEVERFLANLPPLQSSVPLIVETYTWSEQLQGRERLVENICRELAWVREKISLSRR